MQDQSEMGKFKNQNFQSYIAMWVLSSRFKCNMLPVQIQNYGLILEHLWSYTVASYTLKNWMRFLK